MHAFIQLNLDVFSLYNNFINYFVITHTKQIHSTDF
jgi:hypothetical protein